MQTGIYCSHLVSIMHPTDTVHISQVSLALSVHNCLSRQIFVILTLSESFLQLTLHISPRQVWHLESTTFWHSEIPICCFSSTSMNTLVQVGILLFSPCQNPASSWHCRHPQGRSNAFCRSNRHMMNDMDQPQWRQKLSRRKIAIPHTFFNFSL